MTKNRHEREEINWMIAQEIPALRRYAQILLRNSDKNDDLVQDTLERAIKKSHTWRREGSIRSWLYRILYTTFINRYSKPHLKEVAAQDVIDNSDMPEPESPEGQVEARRVMHAANTLQSRYREVLLLVAVEGFSYDEVAGIMDIPVGTVRSRLARAREDLRAELKTTGMNGQKATGAGQSSTVRSPSIKPRLRTKS